MPMKRFAEEVTPFGLVKELEGRLSLKIPDKVVKEITVYESYDQQSSRLTLVWWNDEEEDKIKPAEVIKTIVKQVTTDRPDVKVTLSPTKRSFDTSQVMVKLDLMPPQEKEAVASSGPVKTIMMPLSIHAGGNDYVVSSSDMGTTFNVLRNEVILKSNVTSVAIALGFILKYVLVDLIEVENLTFGKSNGNVIDKEFIGSIAGWFANSPVVTKEALKNLTAFMELVTKKKFEPEE